MSGDVGGISALKFRCRMSVVVAIYKCIMFEVQVRLVCTIGSVMAARGIVPV